MVEVGPKLAMPQLVHFDGHANICDQSGVKEDTDMEDSLSQVLFTLSATNSLPSQMPLAFALTQRPELFMNRPCAQVKQSASPGPLQLPHELEHTLHSVPALKVLSGQKLPVLNTGRTGSHLVLSFAFNV